MRPYESHWLLIISISKTYTQDIKLVFEYNLGYTYGNSLNNANNKITKYWWDSFDGKCYRLLKVKQLWLGDRHQIVGNFKTTTF